MPALRFAEFSGEWETKTLNHVVKINQGLQIPISERLIKPREGAHFYITNEFLKKGTSKQYYILNPPSSVLCNTNDILMTRTGNTGIVVTNVEGVFHNNFFKIAYPEYIEKNFLFSFLGLHKTKNQILRYAGTSTIPDLNHSDFYRLIFHYPKPKEQQKIASFLTSVDTKIEQLGKKKALLEQYKKGMMQKLFPSTGSGCTPALRFKPGFDSAHPTGMESIAKQVAERSRSYPDWEEKRLGDIADFSKGKGISKNDIDETGTLECIRYGQLYTDYEETIRDVKSRTNIPSKQLVLSEANDIIIPASGETQIDIATASCVLKSGIALGGDLNIIKTKHDGVFLSYYLNSVRKIDIARLSQGISVVHLYAAQLKLIHLNLPVIAEQQKIANFLSAIDQKINLITTELNLAKTFKKGLLQQMFV